MKKSSLRGSNGKTVSNKTVESQPKPVMKIGEIGGVGSISGGTGTSSSQKKQQTAQVNTNFNQGGSVQNTAPVTTGGKAPKVNQTLVSGFSTQTTNPASALGTSTGGVTNNLALNNTSDAASSITNKNASMAQGMSGPAYNQPTGATNISGDKKPLFDKKTGKSEGDSAPAKGFAGLGGKATSPDATGVSIGGGAGGGGGASPKGFAEMGGTTVPKGGAGADIAPKEIIDGPGISKERPTLVLLADYKPLCNKEGKFTNVGEHFNKQLNFRNLRQDVINSVFSSQIDSNISNELKDNFNKGVSSAYNGVLSIFDVITKMNNVKNSLNLKSELYDSSGENIIETLLIKLGYDKKSVKKFSSTKLFLQLLIELKRVVRYSSFLPSNKKIVQSDQDSPHKLLFNDGYGFIGNDSIPTSPSVLIAGTKEEISNNIKSIFSLFGTEFSEEEYCGLTISTISKDYKCRKAYLNSGFVKFLTDTYGTISSDPFLSILDYVVGVFGDYDTSKNEYNDKISLSSLSLTSQSDKQILTFESDYLLSFNKFYTPGGVYYVDSLLNGNINNFVSNLSIFSGQLEQKINNIKKFFEGLSLNTTPFDVSDPHYVINTIRELFFDQVLTEKTRYFVLKSSFVEDPFIFLVKESQFDPNVSIDLTQFLICCAYGNKEVAKDTLNRIFSRIFVKTKIFWGGADNVDGPQVEGAPPDAVLDDQWWANKKNEKVGDYLPVWINASDFYNSILSLTSSTDDEKASKLGRAIIETIKSMIEGKGNQISSPNFMSNASKFCILCKIIFMMLSRSSDHNINEIWTRSNMSFGDKSKTTTMVSTTTTTTYFFWAPIKGEIQVTKEIYDYSPLPEGPVYIEEFGIKVEAPVPYKFTKQSSVSSTSSVTTGGVTTGDELNSNQEIGTLGNLFDKSNIGASIEDLGKFQISVKRFKIDEYHLRDFLISIEKLISADFAITSKIIRDTIDILSSIKQSMSDLFNKINSVEFKSLFNGISNLSSEQATLLLQMASNLEWDFGSTASSEIGQTSQNSGGLFSAPTGQIASDQINQSATGFGAPDIATNTVDLSFFTRKQISIIANTVLDVKTKVANNSKIKSGNYSYAIDDVLSEKKISDAFFSFFKKEFFDSEKRYKILSIGIPNGFSERLYHKPLMKKNNSLKQNDVISINVYKTDILNPDIIYHPQSFLFETSRYLVTDSFYYKDNVDNGVKTSKFLNNFPTRNFDNLLKNELETIQYYDDIIKDASYSFLSSRQKTDLYYNHIVSYFCELYLKVLTGISLAEKDFYIKDPEKYLDEVTISTIKNTKIPDNIQDAYDMFGLAIEEISRNLTPISSSRKMLYNIFSTRKFERIFNVLFDPNDFIVNVENTKSTQQGKDAFDFAVAKGNIKKSGENYVSERLSSIHVSMDRIFIQITTTNNEQVV